MPTREALVLEPVKLYLEGGLTAVMMVMIGAFGVATLVLSGDKGLALGIAAAAFLLTGIVLSVRSWRMTRPSASSSKPPA
ncbi:MAG TPA: hypothetical protein VG758_07305 [Hyphomicrobiaceae bacterium]|jgi:hypothetical protein|nr:hypothetical protein [Hyphomicrobiaceae bacterium]